MIAEESIVSSEDDDNDEDEDEEVPSEKRKLLAVSWKDDREVKTIDCLADRKRVRGLVE
jgi:hypothetical protein